jgi:hypothetical protein
MDFIISGRKNFEFFSTLSAIVCGRGQKFLQQNKIGYRDKDFDTA